MGTLCIILGIVFLVALSGGGYLLVNVLANYQIMGQSLLSFLGFSSTTNAYLIIVGIFFIIGLLLCITYVMIGFNSRRCSSIARKCEDLEYELHNLKKKVKKSSSSSKKEKTEAEAEDDMFDTTENDR